MKPILYFILLFLAGTFCEDVIEAEIPSGESHLIVDALMRVGIDDELIPFEIKVATTNNFLEEIPATELEGIVILVYSFDEEYLVTDVTFYKGQHYEFSYFYDQTLDPGTQLEFGILGQMKIISTI